MSKDLKQILFYAGVIALAMDIFLFFNMFTFINALFVVSTWGILIKTYRYGNELYGD